MPIKQLNYFIGILFPVHILSLFSITAMINMNKTNGLWLIGILYSGLIIYDIITSHATVPSLSTLLYTLFTLWITCWRN